MHRLVTYLPFVLVFSLLGTFIALFLLVIIGSFTSAKWAGFSFIVVYPLALLIGSPVWISACIVFCIFISKFSNRFNQYYQNKFYTKATLLGLYLGVATGLVLHTTFSIFGSIPHHLKHSKYLNEPFLSIDLLNHFFREFIALPTIMVIVVPSAVCGFVAIKFFGRKVIKNLSQSG